MSDAKQGIATPTIQCLPDSAACQTPHPASCKICDGPVVPVGSVDFHHTHLDPSPFPHAGIDTLYYQCRQCGFAWAPMFDDWRDETFSRYIYNAAIPLIETADNAAQRSDNIMALFHKWFRKKRQLRFLDYGCGPGVLVNKLREQGFSAEGYDRFYTGFGERPRSRFHVVTCFEVMEHANDPSALIRDLLSFLRPGGIVVMGTFLTQVPMPMDWWYISPRSGHISFYTVAALNNLYARHGYTVASDGTVFHIAYRDASSKIVRNILRQ